MKIWAHRGCSQRYPENTLTAFSKAAELSKLTGIELDIQLTKDGQMVVIHDETVDRTTDGSGNVNTFTLGQLKKLGINAGNGRWESIPTIEEVLDLLEDRLKEGLMLNIELKNSVIPYEGMEQKIVDLIHQKRLEKSVVYSSFNARSIELIKKINPTVKTGILDTKVSDCLYKKMGGCGADALHPFWKAMDLNREELKGNVVRAWFSGHLYPEKPTGTKLDIEKLENMGITDVFLNEPELYL